MVEIIETAKKLMGFDLPSGKRARRLGSLLLLSAGVLLLAYVAGSYGSMYAKQRSLMHQWEAQNLRPLSSVSTPAEDRLTRLSIPKINLDVVILEGTSNEALAQGPGHLKNTAFPGESGNAVIAAHRDTFFRKIYELKNGDDVYVQREGRKYHYMVTSKRVVEPTDLSVLDDTGESRLTLITCYPIHFIGPAPQRLIVFAKLVKEA